MVVTMYLAKALRMLAHAAALGFARVVLFRSWRVDKAWLQSRAFDPDVQREQLLLGLEQAGRTRLPEVLRFDRFKPLVEDALPALALPTQRFVAHPAARANLRRRRGHLGKGRRAARQCAGRHPASQSQHPRQAQGRCGK